MRKVLWIVLLLTMVGWASDVLENETELAGHPRARFPLSVSIDSSDLDPVVQQALDDWNRAFQSAFKLDAFRRVDTDGDIRIHFLPNTGKLMGETQLSVGKGGVINLPIVISVLPPEAKGQTSKETLLFEIVAHELGHAVGLPHVHDPSSLMCCIHGSIDFNDPKIRDAYIEARRHPDVMSVVGQLKVHYDAFWRGRTR